LGNLGGGGVVGPAVGADKGAAAYVFVRQRLAKDSRGRRHGAAQKLGDLLKEVLVEGPALLLQLVGIQVV